MAVTGPGGHSWSDYGAGNPVHALSRAIAEFTSRSRPVPERSRAAIFLQLRTDPGRHQHQLHPHRGARQSGSAFRESRSRSTRWRRCWRPAVAQAAETENSRATGGRVTARLKEIGSRPGGELREGAPILNCLLAVDAFLGIRSRLDCSSTDANIPLSLGIPGGVHRRGRAGRRSAHSRGMVSSGRPRIGLAPDSAGAVRAAAGGVTCRSVSGS